MTEKSRDNASQQLSTQSLSAPLPDNLQERLEAQAEALVVTSLMPMMGDLLRAAVAGFDEKNEAIKAEAEGLTLKTAEEIAAAKKRRIEINAERQTRIKPLLDGIVGKITKAEAQVREMFEASMAARAGATKLIDQKVAEAEAVLRAEAEERRQAAERALRQAKEKEERLAREARERADEQRRQAEEAERRAATAKSDKKRRELEEEAQRQRDLAAQNDQRAEDRLATAESIEPEAAQVVMPDTTVGGYSSRRKWKHRVTDKKAICRQIAAGTLSEDLVSIVAAEANALAKATKKTRTIDGFEFFEDTTGASTLK